MKRLPIIILLSTCLLLTGCATEADRIYTVCCIDNGTEFVYDGSGRFYTVTATGELTPNINPNLIRKPCLMLLPSEGDFNFTYILPGLYTGTLESVNHYVYTICSDLSTIELIYSDANNLEVIVPSGDNSIRILFNIRGEVRIYSSDGEIPIYLNDK